LRAPTAQPAGAATASFATECAAAQAALAEDACFWVGAAARRAGQTATARDALQRFLQRFPSSARAGEAAGLLGWILLEAADLDGAERRFRQAAGDRVPKIRESASRGLTEIERKRAEH
jgi:TolA-binding protein